MTGVQTCALPIFITCVLYKGTERVDILDRKDFNEDLFTNYENGLKFLKQNLRLRYIIKGAGPRLELLELPEEALREALLNSIVHRDYFDEGFGVFVEMFDDRVEITNKGKLLFDRKKLGTISVLRNPLIFDLFYRLKLMEKVGSGINRIKELVKKEGLRVAFEVDDFFRIIFRRDVLSLQKTPQKTPQKPTKLEEGILELLSKNQNLTRDEIAARLTLSSETVKEYLARLKEKGLLQRVGPDKGGHWEILKKG